MVYRDCSSQDPYSFVVSTGANVGAGVEVRTATEVGTIVGTEVADKEDVEVPTDTVFCVLVA